MRFVPGETPATTLETSVFPGGSFGPLRKQALMDFFEPM
jgi:hypothetical protein